jgi:hypothetical protein
MPLLTRGESVSAICCVDSSRAVEFLEIVLITSSSSAGVTFLGRPDQGVSFLNI